MRDGLKLIEILKGAGNRDDVASRARDYDRRFGGAARGRRVTHGTLWLLERLRIVPRGTTQVSGLLNLAAASIAEAGRLGIFSPMYFVLARKPE